MQVKLFTMAAAFAAGSQALAIAGVGINGNSLTANTNPILNNLLAGTLDPKTLLSGLLSTTTANSLDQATVLGNLTTLTTSLTDGLALLKSLNFATLATPVKTKAAAVKPGLLSGLLGSLGLGNLLGGSNSGTVGTASTTPGVTDLLNKLGGIQDAITLLFTNIGRLPIDAQGYALPANQQGLCTLVDGLLQLEAKLLLSLNDKSVGLLSPILADSGLGSVTEAVIKVQLLLQTLVLQILSLTPICAVQSSEGMSGLTGVFTNVLGTVSSLLSVLLGPTGLLGNSGLLTLVGKLLGTGTTSVIPPVPSTPLSGLLGLNGVAGLNSLGSLTPVLNTPALAGLGGASSS